LQEDVFPGEFIGFFQHDYKRAPKNIINDIPKEWFNEFPTGSEIFSFIEKIIPAGIYGNDVDKLLIKRRDLEYKIFQTIEEARFEEYKKKITDIKKLIEVANKITNSRKSRSGHSLEYNLASIFKYQKIRFETNVTTENRKHPDFLFPSESAYHNRSFPAERLNMLGAKTCCKDRWRQIVTEADRIRPKHLFTLQEGISSHQLQEMEDNGIVLVVPSKLKSNYPSKWHNKILNLSSFIKLRKDQESLSKP
jgi:type II restriction enzyme